MQGQHHGNRSEAMPTNAGPKSASLMSGQDLALDQDQRYLCVPIKSNARGHQKEVKR